MYWFRFDRCTVGDEENEEDPARAGCLHTQDAGTPREGRWSYRRYVVIMKR